ncbi:hypothetical protein D9611_005181 [Ephemerocybe angulata]|uniref:Uncharacterized protein n=1 Tax=Ephemerocybe angulata TaxID=980116 RepID=A0A8H5C0B7_9AGAR|nr:hypothetical protein D9611_005181 [Tulosesus angulatus]
MAVENDVAGAADDDELVVWGKEAIAGLSQPSSSTPPSTTAPENKTQRGTQTYINRPKQHDKPRFYTVPSDMTLGSRPDL